MNNTESTRKDTELLACNPPFNVGSTRLAEVYQDR